MGNETSLTHAISHLPSGNYRVTSKNAKGESHNSTKHDEISYDDEGKKHAHDADTDVDADATQNESSSSNEIIDGCVTLMGFETANERDHDIVDEHKDTDPPRWHDYGWWSYTFNAKNKYIIHVQFEMKSMSWNSNAIKSMKHLNIHKLPGTYQKYGARFCTINGKQADIISFSNSHKKISNDSNHINEYDNNEYIILQIEKKIYRLFFLKHIGWCFDDGAGVYSNIKRTVNGKLNI
eukprot:211204_1